MLAIPLFKYKKARNLIEAIHKSKRRGLSRFLYGLGIRRIGEKAARMLAVRFNEIEVFFILSESDLEAIPEIGHTMAAAIVSFFSAPKIKRMIKNFKEAGLMLSERKADLSQDDILGGRSFVFTGEMGEFSRQEAQSLVDRLGGRWSSSVSKNTDFVVAGENPGSKHEKAEKLGITILNEEEFTKMIEGRE